MLMNWPADKVERRSVESLVFYARNSRTHSAEQVAQIAASIKEWGWTVPVLIEPDGGIIAGHGRIMAAQKLGIVEVPCMVAEGWSEGQKRAYIIAAEGWSEGQKRAYIIADNKLPLNAGWDMDALKVEFQEIDGLGFNLELTGFGTDELTVLFDNPDFSPGTEDDQGKLDELAPKMVTCPHCSAEWDLREHGQG